MNFVEPFPKDRINDIANWLKNYNEMYYVIFLIGISVGIRSCDILKLKIQDLKNTDKITIKEQKTGKTKTFPLKPYVAKVVKDYIKKYCNEEYQEYIFLGKKGARLDRSAVYRVFNRCIKELGINMKCGNHSSRKFLAKNLYLQTKDIALVMEILNHSNMRTTFHYLGITQDRINEAYQTVDLGLNIG